jgi:hypothetical protein
MRAIISAETEVKRPTVTSFFSDAFLLMNFLYTSNVKIVDVELNIDAREEMTAAERAANARPLTTVGVKWWIRNG